MVEENEKSFDEMLFRNKPQAPDSNPEQWEQIKRATIKSGSKRHFLIGLAAAACLLIAVAVNVPKQSDSVVLSQADSLEIMLNEAEAGFDGTASLQEDTWDLYASL